MTVEDTTNIGDIHRQPNRKHFFLPHTAVHTYYSQSWVSRQLILQLLREMRRVSNSLWCLRNIKDDRKPIGIFCLSNFIQKATCSVKPLILRWSPSLLNLIILYFVIFIMFHAVLHYWTLYMCIFFLLLNDKHLKYRSVFWSLL